MSSTEGPKSLEDIVIDKILDMKEFFDASFTLKGRKESAAGSLSSEGTELSVWAKKPENKKYQETIARFSNGIKDIFLDEDMIEQLHAFEELQPPLKSIEDKSQKNVEDNEDYNKILMKYPIFKGKFSDIKKEYQKLKTKKERTEFLHAFEELQTLKSIEDKSPKEVEDNEDFNKILIQYPKLATFQQQYKDLKSNDERMDFLGNIINVVRKDKEKQLKILKVHYFNHQDNLTGTIKERQLKAISLAEQNFDKSPYDDVIKLINQALQKRINLYTKPWENQKIPTLKENFSIIDPMDSFMFSLQELLRMPEEREFGGRLTMKIFLSTHPALTQYLNEQLSPLKNQKSSPLQLAHSKFIKDLEQQKLAKKNKEQPNEVKLIKQKIALLTDIEARQMYFNKILNKEKDPIKQDDLRTFLDELGEQHKIILDTIVKNQLAWVTKLGYWDNQDQKNIESLKNANQLDEYRNVIKTRYYRVYQKLEAEKNEQFRQKIESVYSELQELHKEIEGKRGANLPVDDLQKKYQEKLSTYNNLSNQYFERQINWIKEIGYWTNDLQKTYDASKREPQKWQELKNFIDNCYLNYTKMVDNTLQHLKPHEKQRDVKDIKELEEVPSKQMIFSEQDKPKRPGTGMKP